jgi:hypothetical protein
VGKQLVLADFWFLVNSKRFGSNYFSNMQDPLVLALGLFSKFKTHRFQIQVQSFRLLVLGLMGITFIRPFQFQVQPGPDFSVNNSPIKRNMFVNCFHIQNCELVRVCKQSWLGYVSIQPFAKLLNLKFQLYATKEHYMRMGFHYNYYIYR